MIRLVQCHVHDQTLLLVGRVRPLYLAVAQTATMPAGSLELIIHRHGLRLALATVAGPTIAGFVLRLVVSGQTVKFLFLLVQAHHLFVIILVEIVIDIHIG